MKPEDALAIADDLHTQAALFLAHARKLDTSSTGCNCCEARRYNNWPQKQLHDQLIGAIERLNTISATLRRRSHDVYFLTGKDSDDQK